MNEQTDEQITMQREWLELQRQRFQLDTERDRVWLEHITRQTEAMESMARALVARPEQPREWTEPKSETVVLSQDLVRNFHEYVQSLPLPTRVCHSLLRGMGSSHATEVEGWVGSDFNNVAFTVRRRYVPPEDWALAVMKGWKDKDLMSVRNFGKDSLRHLKNAITEKLT